VRNLLLLLGCLLIACCGCSATPAKGGDDFAQRIFKPYPELKEQPYTVDQVSRIVDGDTFETKSGAKVRLIGVNTPEITNGKNEPYGAEAKDFAKQKLEGRTVYMFRDAGDTDKYGRLLRYVFIESDEVMFNELLVSEGYANTMTVPPNVIYAKKFVAAERAAREQNKGLWGIGGADKADPAPASPLPAAKCDAPSIKGNINAKGDKIYHVPGGRNYEQTKAEIMFCSEQEAKDAGFRKSER